MTDIFNDKNNSFISNINIERFLKSNPRINNDWKIPSNPLIKNKREEPAPKREKDRRVILEPLDEVFFDDTLMDELVIRTAIPQLLDAQQPVYQGVILYGPPGTGKSEFQRAVVKVFDRAGAYAKQVSSSQVNTCLVGGLATNLEQELNTANQQGRIRGLPSFLSFDEGSIFAEQAKTGAWSVGKHYQEAIDVLKRYVGNDIGKWLVLAISTNSLPEDFEEAITREGRLTSFLINYPTQEQTARMWKHFSNKNNVLTLSDEQAIELANLSSRESGAFIAQFCKAYKTSVRQELLRQRGYANLRDALADGKDISEEDIRNAINYKTLAEMVSSYIEMRNKMNGRKPEERKVIGFSR